MNNIIAFPTVEQINLEHRLANSKASEAVQHATNCGLMLLQIKASKQHGEWLPWLKQQQESGAIDFSESTAKRYMRVAANRSRVTDLEAPSIRAALELLSDKEPEEQQGTLLDVAAERQAREAAEAKAEAERQAREFAEQQLGVETQRAGEWKEESNERRKKVRELEEKIDLLTIRDRMMQDRLEQANQEINHLATVVPEPEKVVVAPEDYEHLKQTERDLRSDLAELKQQQRELVQQQVVAKLKERESELAEIDRKVQRAESLLTGLQTQIDRYSMAKRELKVHLDTIESARVSMAVLAANLEGFEAVIDPDTELRQWRALADMLRNGAAAIEHFVGNTKPALSVIRGEAA